MSELKTLSMDAKDNEVDDNFWDDEHPLALGGGEFLPEQELEKHVVLLVGAGEIAQEISRLGSYAGFTVDVVDNRIEYAKPERFPAARQTIHCSNYADLEKRYDIGPRHYIVIATHSFDLDLEVLRYILHSKARYIGVHGDEQKQEKLFAILRKEGMPAAELACICCPIGVPIGAVHPAEIGIAIIAELIAARSGCLTAPRAKKKVAKK